MTKPELKLMKFKDGEVIFREGGAIGGVYLIHEGTVEISRVQNGEKQILANLGWNKIFGEMSLIDQTPRIATATAAGDVFCYYMDEAQFKKRLNEADPFLRGVVQQLVSNLRHVMQKNAETKLLDLSGFYSNASQ